MNKDFLRLGLIGKDVSHSTSDVIHTFILQQFGLGCTFEKFSVDYQDFDAAIRRLMGDFDGFNVTIPYKRDVFAYLDGVQGDALACGAVNTVVTATKQGYNTDTIGALYMIENAGICVRGKRVLVLGVGGAGRSTAVTLKNAGATVYVYRRNQQELMEICQQLGVIAANNPEDGGFDILINCTGVGMHDTEGVSPVTAAAFAGASVAVDLIYWPQKTKFLEIAEQCGLQILNGEAMLFYQAYFADCIYLGKTPSKEQANDFYQKYKNQKKEG